MYLKVFVTPGAKHERITERGDALVLAVKEPASANRANDRVRAVIAARFGTSVRSVRIISGHHSRSKMLSIADR